MKNHRDEEKTGLVSFQGKKLVLATDPIENKDLYG
jgi:hypothetical protein